MVFKQIVVVMTGQSSAISNMDGFLNQGPNHPITQGLNKNLQNTPSVAAYELCEH